MSLFNKKKRAGFTLIELLVVIAVVGVLAGAVIVVVNPAKQFQRARDAKRIQDLRVLSNALNQYLVVNGTMPPTPSACGGGCPQDTANWLIELGK